MSSLSRATGKPKRPYNRKPKVIAMETAVRKEEVEVAKPVNLTDTPEFKEAVAKAATKAAAEAVAKLLPKAAAFSDPTDAASLMSQLAMAISHLTDQGMPEERKRIPPEELAKREAARDRMGRLIMDCRARGVKPQYRALNKSVLNEVTINPYTRGKEGKMEPVTFGWDGEPNDVMYPLDADAVEIFEAFRESRGAYSRGPNQKKPVWATAGGVIINGAGPRSMREIEIPVYGDAPASERFQSGLSVQVANDPNAKHVNILGTIAAPAVQNYAGERADQ